MRSGVRRFDKYPGQMLVAVLGVAFALLLSVAHVSTIDAAGVRGEIADGGKALVR